MLLEESSDDELKEGSNLDNENESDIDIEFVESTEETKDLGYSSGFIERDDETSVKTNKNECETWSKHHFS